MNAARRECADRSSSLGVLAAALLLAACGGGSSGGPANINVWVFNEPSGSFKDAAKRCTDQSGGTYKITLNALSNDADQQRQSLVRRLAAKDSSDRHRRHGRRVDRRVRRGRVDQAVARRTSRPRSGRARCPARSRPRPTRASSTPRRRTPTRSCSGTARTWSSKPADDLERPDRTRPRSCPRRTSRSRARSTRASRCGSTRSSQSAGGTIVEGNQGRRSGPPEQAAASIMSKLAHLAGRRPVARQPEGGPEPPRLRVRATPPSRSTTRSSIRARRRTRRRSSRTSRWAPYPGVVSGKPAKAPIGGINWGVGAYTKHPQEAFAAAACMRNAENQKEAAIKGGLPPTLDSALQRPGAHQGLSVRRR